MKRLKEILGQDLYCMFKRTNAEEIRIKRNAFLVIKDHNRMEISERYVSSQDFDNIFERACNYSYHSHEDTIKKGYVNAGEGIRIGLCGRAVTDNDIIASIADIEYLVIRIPHYISGVCCPIIEHLGVKTDKSILLYSPPGVGKTTLIRDISVRLSSKPILKRVVLLDTRQEIYLNEMSENPLIAVYSGYPKKNALEAAIRTMSPDYVITDEIGSNDEAEALIKYQNSGVSLIATAHADSLESLLHRQGIRPLHDYKCFDAYCMISRYKNKYDFKFYSWEEAQRCLKLQDCV